MYTWGNGLRTGREAGEEVFAVKDGVSYNGLPLQPDKLNIMHY
jgi:hypothetical protein